MGVIRDEKGTVEDILCSLVDDDNRGRDTSYRLVDKGVTVSTCGRGTVFSVSKHVNEGGPSRTEALGHWVLEDFTELAELIDEFSVEKLDSFREAGDYKIWLMVDSLKAEEKDELLYRLLMEKKKEETDKGE